MPTERLRGEKERREGRKDLGNEKRRWGLEGRGGRRGKKGRTTEEQ